MIVLGVDPGLANLGLGLVEGDVRKARHLHHICLTTESAWVMPRRLQYLHSEVSRLLAEYQPDAVAIEDQILRRQADVAFKVGQAFGVVQLACAQAGVPIHAYGPMQVKRSLVGTGRADKEQVIYMVKASLGLGELFNNHAADALALALTHLAHQSVLSASARLVRT
ncbi:crossover junction endodeoxyribonuclease RuvC [Deinococcus aetherius]|uniref:Crossover junction endodeoxyribonuclease RuvC n=1 Tax=Deinococcus aetherius TaxID=200252 RepID=A0ABN6RA57_9DEIO|nr:crossover junction endodeoxyribonuclease RuvC [Deinococcus aetherius]BDP40235.1 crossover junction endodeoxyribonuclease RuvC [Deinococcus aetherius]